MSFTTIKSAYSYTVSVAFMNVVFTYGYCYLSSISPSMETRYVATQILKSDGWCHVPDQIMLWFTSHFVFTFNLLTSACKLSQLRVYSR